MLLAVKAMVLLFSTLSVLFFLVRAADASNSIDLFSRNALRDPSAQDRRTISRSSDILQYSLMAAPLVLDSYHLLAKTGDELNWRPLVSDFVAFGVTFGFTTLAKEFLSRDRPYVQECNGQRIYDNACGTSTSNKSFFSGHTSMAFTGAALLCSDNMRTNGLPVGVCIMAMGAAATTGVLRIMADKHYATDVLVGAAVGTLSGVFIPKLLSVTLLKRKTPPPSTKPPEGTQPFDPTVSVSPMINGKANGIQATVHF